MCGIIGLFNNSLKTKKGLQALKNRGVDESDSVKVSNGEIGHCLHAVVSHVKQPLKEKGILAANCEIYNWKELNHKYAFNARNDAELLLKLLDKFGVKKTLKIVDGDYAFIYYDGKTVWAARDPVGVKPLWYSQSNGLGIASEKRALEEYDFTNIRELVPRQTLEYANAKAKFHYTPIKQGKAVQKSFDQVVSDLKKIIGKSVEKRIPEIKYGLLFSGGIDSLIIAKMLQDAGQDFTCYAIGLKNSSDLTRARRETKKFGLKLRVKEISEHEIKSALTEIIPLIEDTNVVKAGVGLVTHFATQLAREDGVKVLMSGVGADELFAGYHRHAKSGNVNHDCYSDLLKIFEKNTYRDDVLSMNNSVELRFPYLDKRLINYAFRIPRQFKIEENTNKYCLRKLGERIGVGSGDKKVAAQYGSGIDKTLDKLAKGRKSFYLKNFWNKPNLKLGALFSGGKDSARSLEIMSAQNYEVTCLITVKSRNPESYMFHTPNISITELQAQAMQKPIITVNSRGVKEDELKDLKRAMRKAVNDYGIEGIITGALYSNYQRSRVERLCDELGLKVFSPLWHADQYEHFKQLLNDGYEIVLSSIAADGLDESWLGRTITMQDLEELKKLSEKNGLNIAGEGGEFESLVLNAPMFKKKIVIEEKEINGNEMIVLKARLA